MNKSSENAAIFCDFGASATCYGCAENVGIVPIVVLELEFGDVQREVFAADLVEATHDQKPSIVAV